MYFKRVIKKQRQTMCARYKATINKFLQHDNYYSQNRQFICEIAWRKVLGRYCSLNINQAYLHTPVSEDITMLQTISTLIGTNKVKKLVFSIKVTPNIWQHFMDPILVDLRRCTCSNK